MAVKWLREKSLFLPDYCPFGGFGRRGVRRDAVSLSRFGLGFGLVLRLVHSTVGHPSYCWASCYTSV